MTSNKKNKGKMRIDSYIKGFGIVKKDQILKEYLIQSKSRAIKSTEFSENFVQNTKKGQQNFGFKFKQIKSLNNIKITNVMQIQNNKENVYRKNYYRTKTAAGKQDQRAINRMSNPKKPSIPQNPCQNEKQKYLKNDLKPSIISEYAINSTENDKKILSPRKSNQKDKKFKEIEKRFQKKLETQHRQRIRKLSNKKSVSSSKSRTGAESLHSKDRFENASGSKQKYMNRRITIGSRRPDNYKSPYSNAKKETIKNRENGADCMCRQQCIQMKEQLEKYKALSYKSLKTLGKMDSYIKNEKKKHEIEKSIILQKLKHLELQTGKKFNLGHLFHFKDFSRSKMLPSSLILQTPDENLSSLESYSVERYEKILEEYLEKQMNENSPEESSLSLQSK